MTPHNCHTCTHLSHALGWPMCTATGPALTRWRVNHKSQGEMPAKDAPDCPGWKGKG